THTMGLLVGATPLDTFGVAPEAEWITAGVIDQGGPLNTTISDILDAFEWALDPDGDSLTTDDVPDVILNSWGIPKGLFAPCDETFHQVIDNVEAAGIVTIFAAGNEGPDPKTMRNPADRASTPTNTLAVGAVDGALAIASFSSRGPSACDTTQIKPEVVAPGVSVRSSFKGGGYSLMSGTSMAAPFVAGLAVLMRQYDPDVTVEEIKNAIIQSCTDLGDPGEDNAYGYGIPDASRLLDFLPPPDTPLFALERIVIGGDGLAFPGEEFNLQLMLRRVAGSVESVDVALIPLDTADVTVSPGEATFYFGTGGTLALNATPFLVTFDAGLPHGRVMPFDLIVRVPGGTPLDTLRLNVTVGISPPGTVASHVSDGLGTTVSDFGQFGFAPGSIYNLDGQGLRVGGSGNLLYEAGIILGRNTLQLSSAVRDSSGKLAVSDFTPIEPLRMDGTVGDGGEHRCAALNDTHSDIPIPITVRQQTSSYPNDINNGFLIVRCFLKNDSIERLTSLSFGFLADFDLPGTAERCTFDEIETLLYQEGDGGPLVGLLGLENISTFHTLANGISKTGFTRSELYGLISAGQSSVDQSSDDDLMFLAAGGPFTIEPGDSVPVSFALVGGDDPASLYANALSARQRFHHATDVDDNDTELPHGFTLAQNYPNPFNPTTSISFTLSAPSDTRLEIYNVLGRRVTTLVNGPLPAGRHVVVWDGVDGAGKAVA
ncbi:MAG: S8 family serine peptidase, partial [Candidatus Zixiibacteriota bacterium]